MSPRNLPPSVITDQGDGTATVQLVGKAGGVAIIDSADAHLLRGRRFWMARFPGRTSAYAMTSSSRPASGNARDWRTVGLHRLLMPDVPEIDHRDRNALNNRRSNLRPATRSENVRNCRSKVNAHGYKGISRVKAHRRPFVAWIGLHGKRIYLGHHETALLAALAYDRGARKYHGEFACPNFTEPFQ